MKTLIIISTFLFFCACNSPLKPDINSITKGKEWDIKLENDLGRLKITLPKHFDTLFKWTQYSDCGDGCANIDYRVQPKKLPFRKESGFIYFPLKDSVEQFTVKHSKLNYLQETD